VKLLLDTHLLIWAATAPERVSKEAATLILGADSVYFSVINIWEIAIKAALGRPDFRVDPANLRRGLLDNSYIEIPVTGVHAIAVGGLPPIHRDPFDRMLVAQATIEGLTLITADRTLASYPGPIRLVG
jgi:PIN domain nuclease of toxin-antitoxin system